MKVELTEMKDKGLPQVLGLDQTENENIALPQALKLVGDSNQYQWRIFATMCLILSTVSFHVTSQAFTFIQPPLLCDGQPCSNYANYCDSSFTITVDKDNFKYDNVVTDYKLWCGRKYLATIAQSSYFLGSIFGGAIMSYFGDKYGRKKIYIISWAMFSFGSIGLLTSESIYQYIVMNAVMGFGGISVYFLNFVILNETCGKKFRQTSSVGILIAMSVAEIFASFMYYVVLQWKFVLAMVIVIPTFIELGLTFLIQETPQYFCNKKQITQLIECLDEIALVNKKQTFSSLIPSIQDRLDPLFNDFQSNKDETTDLKTYNITDLFKYKSLRNSSIGFAFLSFTVHLIFYGGEYSISNITDGNSLYILGAVMAVAEIFGYTIIYLVIHKLPRRQSLLMSYIFSIVCCFSFLFFGMTSNSTKVDCNFCSKKVIVIVLACLIRVLNSFGFAIQGLYANEVYPTCVRSLGTGFLFSVVFDQSYEKGIFGSFLSPYIIAISDAININPYILIGAISLCGPFATLLIPETLNKKLQDKISENTIQDKDEY